MNPNYKDINASFGMADPNSVYNYFARMVALREKTPALVYGDYKDLDPANAHVFAYTRAFGSETYLVVLNFSRDTIAYELPGGLKAGKLLISNLPSYEAETPVLKLRGWEARVYKQ